MKKTIFKKLTSLMIAVIFTAQYLALPVNAASALDDTELIGSDDIDLSLLEEIESSDEAFSPEEETGHAEYTEVGDEDDLSLYTEGDPAESQVYETMISMRAQYPEGMRYTNADSYVSQGILYRMDGNRYRYRGYGCVGFGLILSDAVWGDAPIYEHNDFSKIRVGDLLRLNYDQHTVVVLQVFDDYIVVAEGNYNSSIHWGRKISRKDTKDWNYIHTRYTEEKANLTDEQKVLVLAFVYNFYQTILGRKPDEGGLRTWYYALTDRTSSGADVAQGFVFSKEFMNKNHNDEDFVEIMYKTFLGRASDKGGKDSWVKKLKQGYSRQYVAAGFIGSAEFHKVCDKCGIDPGVMDVDDTRSDSNLYADKEKVAAYVDSLYKSILKRSADPAGKADWVNRICNHEMTAAEVARVGFFTSAEYTNKNTSNEQFLTDIYLAFFNRKPDDKGYNYWLKRMSEGYSRDQVIVEGFGESAEFTNILRSYGLRCAE